MNSGAEAVETAHQGGAQVGLHGQGHPGRTRPRSSSARATSTGARSRSSASRPRRSTATASARSRPASRSSPTATRRRSRRPSRRTRRPSSSSRSRARPASSSRRRATSKTAEAICTAAQRAAHRRRDPDRPRPHRQAVRLPVGGRRARRGDHRQGAVRRLLPGLGGAGATRACWACSSPATTAARSAAIRWPARWPARRSRSSSTRSSSSTRPSWATTSWASSARSSSPHIKEVRGRGLWIGVELHGAGPPLLRAAEGRGHAVQGDARARHPLRAAAGHHAGGDRLGVRARSRRSLKG